MAKKLLKSRVKANTKTGAEAGAESATEVSVKKARIKKAHVKKVGVKKDGAKTRKGLPALPAATGVSPNVLDRLWTVVQARRSVDPAISHSARLLSRGTPKVAQKFGEEAVECIIEAVGGDNAALVCESADVLYHLLVLWVSAGVHPSEVWAELERREGVSGIAEKASRRAIVRVAATTKIP